LSDGDALVFDAALWRWQGEGPAAWYFLTLPDEAAAEVKLATLGMRRGFGSVKVEAAIGGSRWSTSLFPDTRTGSYLLPVKVAVRRAEGLDAGSVARVSLTLL
jgi:Domain of unknown function (DUF1905)